MTMLTSKRQGFKHSSSRSRFSTLSTPPYAYYEESQLVNFWEILETSRALAFLRSNLIYYLLYKQLLKVQRRHMYKPLKP